MDFEWVWVCDDWHTVREEVTMFIIIIHPTCFISSFIALFQESWSLK